MIDSLNRTTAAPTATTMAGPRGSTADALGQADFLRLMTAQMQNQDPLNPMDNSQFLGQMAQFSTVQGIDRMNATLNAMAGGGNDARIATAANLLGHSVLVPGNIARADDRGEIHGVVDLPADAESVVVSYADPETGTILHSETMGPQPAGLVGFAWTDMPDDLAASRGPVRVSVTASAGGAALPVEASVYSRVLSAFGGPSSPNVTLQVEDYGALDTLEIVAFR